MAYANVTDLRRYLDQVPEGDIEDVLLGSILDRASALIDLELGHEWNTAAADTALVFGDGTNYLKVPQPYVADSVTLVTSTYSGVTIPDYIERDGYLVALTTDLTLYPRSVAGIRGSGPPYGAWILGAPYTISATFGYSTVPPALTEACLEIAADLYRFRDAGSIKAAGTAGVGSDSLVTGGALPTTAARILAALAEDTSREWVR